MPSFFGKSHLYRYDIQGGAKSHYLVFVHLPCLHTQMKHLYSHLSLLPFDDYEQPTLECLMNHHSLTRDCIAYLLQRLQIRDRTLTPCFALSYFNKTNKQSYWLDPDLSMKQQLPKGETKPNFTFTYLLYPSIPYGMTDDKARLILYEQLFCNFISSIYQISLGIATTLSASFLRGCFGDQFQPEKNADLLRLIISALDPCEGTVDQIKEKIIEVYRDLDSLDRRSAQNQFVHQISQSLTYGMTHFEMKNTLNETICLGLNHQGVHSRSLLRNEFQVEASWHHVTSIASNKQRQITVTIKQGTNSVRTLIYYTDSTNYTRYCLRLLRLFFEHYRQSSTSPTLEFVLPQLETPLIRKACLMHGASVPDLRSDGESSSSDDQTPSSTRSSDQSANIWTGSLPNLTVQLSSSDHRGSTTTRKDPYSTFAENLNRIDEHEPSPTAVKRDFSPRRSLPGPTSTKSSVGLSCSLASVAMHQLSPCFSCECLVQRNEQESLRHSPASLSSITSTPNRSLLNSRTFLSSTSVPLEPETISVHDETSTDTWLADLQSKISSNTIYDEFDSIPLSRVTSSTVDGRLADNTRRNRYADVIPYDDTRVRLIPTKENLHGYINASHVKVRVENIIYSYIAAESALPLTVHDFWRMISGSNVHVVVMLLGTDPQLCANYFPRTKMEKCRTDEFEIELISEQHRTHFHIRHLHIKHLHGQRRTRSLVHLQYTAWDDTQLPLDTLTFLDFLHVANSFRRHYGETNPCLVHCTAGIGRTGIFILLHVIIQCITLNKKVSVASVLKVMREHRMSLIDRTSSYVFVYRCLIDYLQSSRLI